LKIETLRWTLPFLVGAVVPVFFLSVYLGSRLNRLRQLRASCRTKFDALEEALRARWQAEKSVGRAGGAMPGDANALEQLLSAPGSRWPAEVEKVQKAAAFLEVERAGSAAPETAPSVASFRQAVAEYNTAVERYASALEQFPANVMAALWQLGPLPLWQGARDVQKSS